MTQPRPTTVKRLQLGASRLENFSPTVLRVFLDKTWVHLGDPESARHSFISRLRMARQFGMGFVLRKTLERCRTMISAPHTNGYDVDRLYAQTNFQVWRYRKGDPLPYRDDSLDFIFSEHFLVHLFLDEAMSLIRECYRVLKPYGVIRTCVSDADLRTYEPPEMIGFPSTKLPYSHFAKVKTRYSIYSLTEVLNLAGFEPIPLEYCDRSGRYFRIDPTEVQKSYAGCLDREMVFRRDYITRTKNLIVDGLKKPIKPPAG
jgi:predicted SAM-dependent methyltransferase